MFDSLSPHEVVAAALVSPPGPDVITALASIDVRTLAGPAKVDLLTAVERQAAWLCALAQPVLAEVGNAVEAEVRASLTTGDPPSIAERAAHAEIGAALRLSDTTAGNRLAVARALTTELPAVQQALAGGDIPLWHANAIVEATYPLSPEKARMVADRVLPRARKQTLSQLRRSLNRAVIAVEPKTAAERAKKAHAERSLDWWPREDGMAELRLIASAADIMTVFNTIDTIAKKLQGAGPKRGAEGWLPIDALRSDVLVDLATGGAANVRPAAVHVTIDLPTLLGLQDNPAHLAGYGPMPADLARALAADGRWRRMILDPQTGELLDLGHTSYQPSAELARFVKARDSSCYFPTCSRPSRRHRLSPSGRVVVPTGPQRDQWRDRVHVPFWRPACIHPTGRATFPGAGIATTAEVGT